jgi:hypothetical protein
MSITPSETVTDSHAPMAWTTSIAALALEKLRLGISIDQDEQNRLGLDISDDDLEISGSELDAIGAVAIEFESLSDASEIPLNDLFNSDTEPVRSAIRDSFPTLIAIEREMVPPLNLPDFKQASVNLSSIKEHYEIAGRRGLNPKIVEEAQKVCLELLDHLDKQRPST